MKTKTLFLSILCTSYTVCSSAQNDSLDLSALHNEPGANPNANFTAIATLGASAEYVNTDQVALDAMPPFILEFEQRVVTLNLVMGNTSGITRIAAAIGSSEGSNDIFYKEFDFGTQGEFGDGTSYHAQGNTVQLGLGNYVGSYYAEVFALRSDGTKSERKRYRIE